MKRVVARVARHAAALALLPLATLAVLASATTAPLWPAASELSLPAGANTATSTQLAYLRGVSCTSRGNCVAVGTYSVDGSGGDHQAMVVSETNGTWGQAVELALPAGYNTTPADQNARLNSVSCTSAGNCVAVGSYDDTNGSSDQQAMAATETDGTWAQATEIALPSPHNSSAGGQDASLSSVSCTSPGNCVADGSYLDTNGSNDGQAMVATETNGSWATATELSLPNGASTTAGAQHAAALGLSCTGPGNCVAGGYYRVPGNNTEAMVATEANGTWGQASELSLPAGANTASQHAELESVSCTGAGDCAGAGTYHDSTGDGAQAMVVTETNGVWGQASELSLPAGGFTAGIADLATVACSSAGNCVAGGAYFDTTNTFDQQAMLATETNGSWAQATEVTPPSPYTTTAGDQAAEIFSVTCTGPGVCVGVGNYADQNQNLEAMTLASVAPLAVSTLSLPGAVAGSAYSAQLGATGGAGSYTWAVNSGTLPAGLTLNAATGVISGVPTTPGSATISVKASDPGPPSQQSTATLTITVAGPTITTITHTGTTAHVGVSCSAASTQTCTGTLTLTTLEHHSGRKLTAVTARRRTKKPKKTSILVKLATVSVSVRGGATDTVTVTLGKTGKRLLEEFRRLPAKLVLTTPGDTVAISTRTLTFTARKRRHA